MSNNFNTKASSKVIKGLGTASLFFILMGCGGGGDGGGSGNSGLTAHNPPSSTVNLKMEELIIPEDFSFQSYNNVSLTISTDIANPKYTNVEFELLKLNMGEDTYSYEPVGGAITDSYGNFQGIFRIPINQDVVYIRFNKRGISDIEANIVDGKISISTADGFLTNTL